MKRISLIGMVGLMLVLVFAMTSYADSRYKSSTWPSRLENGALKVRGPGYGSWGTGWVTVATGVSGYQEVGTSKGPVLVYQKGNQWSAVMLDFNTGAKSNSRNFNAATSIFRGGPYGAILKSGNKCYDFSWNQLKAVACQ